MNTILQRSKTKFLVFSFFICNINIIFSQKIIYWTGLGNSERIFDVKNWSDNKVPGINNVIVFNSTSSKNCNIDLDIKVKGIIVEESYKGIIDINTLVSVFVGNYGIKIKGGTVINGHKIYVGGPIQIVNSSKFYSNYDNSANSRINEIKSELAFGESCRSEDVKNISDCNLVGGGYFDESKYVGINPRLIPVITPEKNITVVNPDLNEILYLVEAKGFSPEHMCNSFNTTGTTDYFYFNSTLMGITFPEIYERYYPPSDLRKLTNIKSLPLKSGEGGFIGLRCHIPAEKDGKYYNYFDYKEHLRYDFDEPLKEGERYFVSFYHAHDVASKYSVNNIGYLMSDYYVRNIEIDGSLKSTPVLDRGEHVINIDVVSPKVGSSDKVYNKNGILNYWWDKFTSVYTAKGYEIFMWIGAFGYNYDIYVESQIPESISIRDAYYYIDGIEMLKLPSLKNATITQTIQCGQPGIILSIPGFCENMPYDLMVWKDADGNTLSGTYFNTFVNPKNNATYNLFLNTTNKSELIGTVNVVQNNPNIEIVNKQINNIGYCQNSDSKFEILITGGSPPYTITINGVVYNYNSTTTSLIIPINTEIEGVKSITISGITDSKGCTNLLFNEVVTTTILPRPYISRDIQTSRKTEALDIVKNICLDNGQVSMVVLSIPLSSKQLGTIDYYIWSGTNVVSDLPFSETINRNVITINTVNMQPGTHNYSVYISRYYQNKRTCDSEIITKSINIKRNPDFNINGFAKEYCLGSIVKLYTTPSISGANYLWTGPNGYKNISNNPSFEYDLDKEGKYVVSVTKDGCTKTVDFLLSTTELLNI